MHTTVQYLDDLEAGINRMQQKVTELQDANERLYKLLNVFEKENAQLSEEILLLKGTPAAPAVSVGLESIVEDKRNMQLKISGLIKEIDSCIHQLSS